MGITGASAFIHFNFAPPSLRRHIGLLGFVHKRVIADCHPILCQKLPFASDDDHRYHDRILQDPCESVIAYHRLYNASIYKYVGMYNRLPRNLVHLLTTTVFQAKLTHLAKQRAFRGDSDWRISVSSVYEIFKMCYRH